jgi:hypothetical protein
MNRGKKKRHLVHHPGDTGAIPPNATQATRVASLPMLPKQHGWHPSQYYPSACRLLPGRAAAKAGCRKPVRWRRGFSFSILLPPDPFWPFLHVGALPSCSGVGGNISGACGWIRLLPPRIWGRGTLFTTGTDNKLLPVRLSRHVPIAMLNCLLVAATFGVVCDHLCCGPCPWLAHLMADAGWGCGGGT